MTDLMELEQKLGYSFSDREYLVTALTHTSYANEHRRSGCTHNERLEFLGDAVLELVSSGYLFRKYPGKGEGDLSRKRASMVCESSLAKCARHLTLPDYLRLGRGEEQMGGRQKDSIISDAMEAVIGAVYLDGGFEAARQIVMRHVLLDLDEKDLFLDRKTMLQEVLQEQGRKIRYEVLREEGPDHDRRFTIAAVVDGKILGEGSGHTKKAAAQKAAQSVLELLKQTGNITNVSEIH